MRRGAMCLGARGRLGARCERVRKREARSLDEKATTGRYHGGDRPPGSGSSARSVSTFPASCRAVRSLLRLADDSLVVVDAHVASPTAVATVARAHPTMHFVLVGASVAGLHAPNLAGLVLNEDDAAYLAGVTAGLVAGRPAPLRGWRG